VRRVGELAANGLREAGHRRPGSYERACGGDEGVPDKARHFDARLSAVRAAEGFALARYRADDQR
jgi:hypothetical protein